MMYKEHGFDESSDSNKIEIKISKPTALEEAKAMHHKSINILADHLKTSPQQAEQKLNQYLAGDTEVFGEKDERLSRILRTAKNTHQTLDAHSPNDIEANQSFKKAA